MTTVVSGGRVRRFSAERLLISLVLLLLFTPLFEEWPIGELIEALLMTFVLIAAIMTIGGRGSFLFTAILLLCPALLGRWLIYAFPKTIFVELYFFFGIVFMGLVVFRLLRYALGAPNVNRDVLSAVVSAYLLLGLIWSLAYGALDRIVPGSFFFAQTAHSSNYMDRFNAFYFSFGTLSTVGFGDVTPVSKFARTLSVFEAITGTLYIAVLIARLVSLYSPGRPDPPEEKTTL